jgi:hypothetical protein
MKHPATALILATGGAGLVRAAYSAGKPAFGVGPGNVPAYIEKTADVSKAIRDILTGKCFDNGTLCSSEQSIVCDEAVKDTALDELKKQGAYVCSSHEKAQLERTIQTPRRTLNTKIVGKPAVKTPRWPDSTFQRRHARLLRTRTVSGRIIRSRWRNRRRRLALCGQGLERSAARSASTFSISADSVTRSASTRRTTPWVREFGLRKPAFRICVNTPAALSAVGYTTNLFPAMTLGRGAAGGNITSDNISPLHLINLKRVAYGVRDVAATPPRTTAAAAPATHVTAARTTIEQVVDQWLGWRSTPAPIAVSTLQAQPAQPPPAAPVAPPLSSYKELEPPKPKAEKAESKPVGFVCEDDVRAAILSNAKITVGKKTIITPSARDLGESRDVFILAES